jgi:hypothetical protein
MGRGIAGLVAAGAAFWALQEQPRGQDTNDRDDDDDPDCELQQRLEGETCMGPSSSRLSLPHGFTQND